MTVLTQLLVNGVVAGATYALVGVGFGLVYRTTRFFNFAHGAAITAGAYATFLFSRSLDLPLFLSSLLAVAVVSVLCAVVESGIYRPLRKTGRSPLILLVASLGIYIVAQNAISLAFGDDVKTIRTGVIQEGWPVLGARITPVQVLIIVSALALLSATSLVVSRTRAGKALRAVAADPELAAVSGIDADRVVLLAFAVGSALAAVAGILVCLDTDMSPTMGMELLLMGVIAAIIGGVESVRGVALGALLLGMAQHMGVWKIGSQWQDAVAFVILLAFLLSRPAGFFGRRAGRAAV